MRPRATWARAISAGVIRSAVVRWVVLFALALGSCGGTVHETEERVPGAAGAGAAGTPPASCAENEVLVGGVCEHVGLPQEFPCAPGEWELDGVCDPAGVPVDWCGEGFVHDGDRGCEPVLPAEPCAKGLMAIPGEVACREVAPCAPGTWGDIPVDSNTEHVDPAYTGMSSDGTAQQPWTTIADAIAAAAPGAIVALAAGTYAEDVVIAKPVRLWGRCPALVEITGADAGAAVHVTGVGDGAEVRALSISGSASGLSLSDAYGVRAEELWVHDNPNGGIWMQNNYQFEMLGSLVELSGEAGFFADNSGVEIAESVVRDSLPDSAGLSGSGIDVREGNAMIFRAVIERNHTAGIAIADGQMFAMAIVVRDTLPDSTGAYGWGVSAQSGAFDLNGSLVERNRGVGVDVRGWGWISTTVVRNTSADELGLAGWGVAAHIEPPTSQYGEFVVRRSLVENNREVGVFGGGLRLIVVGTVVRGTQPNEMGSFGRGIDVELSPNSSAPAQLTLGASVIENNHEVGVFVSGREAFIDTSVVRTTQPGPGGEGGRGIVIQPQAGIATTFDLFASVVEQNHEVGVSVAGTDAVLRELVIRDTLPRTDGRFGRGVNVEHDASMGVGASLTMQSTLIEGSYEAGLALIGATGEIEKSIVRDSRASGDGQFGDGVLVLADGAAAGAVVVQSRIEASARAAIAMFGAHVALGESQLVCQVFDVAGEPWNQVQSVFEELGDIFAAPGDNWCGCPTVQAACTLVSAGLEAP